MQIDVAELVKIATGCGSAAGGVTAAWAFARPFADRFFTRWLDRADRRDAADQERAKVAMDKERALERIAILHERTVGILENALERLDRLDARQDRVEAHLGIPMTASSVPAAPAPIPRRAPTDPDMRAVTLPTGAPAVTR